MRRCNYRMEEDAIEREREKKKGGERNSFLSRLLLMDSLVRLSSRSQVYNQRKLKYNTWRYVRNSIIVTFSHGIAILKSSRLF